MKTGKPITGLYNKINIDYSEQADTEREYPPVAVTKRKYSYANCSCAVNALCTFAFILPVL